MVKTWLKLVKSWLKLVETWLNLVKTWLKLVKTWLNLVKTWLKLVKTWLKLVKNCTNLHIFLIDADNLPQICLDETLSSRQLGAEGGGEKQALVQGFCSSIAFELC